MGNYDVRFAAYEKAIKQNPAWANMTKAQREAQMGNYALGLQQADIKAAKKLEGKMFAKMLAEEKAFQIMNQNPVISPVATGGATWGTLENPAIIGDNLHLSKNLALSNLNQSSVVQLSTQDSGINVVRKTKVGTKKTGFKYFFADDAGKVYQVDKSTYNAIEKTGNIKLSGAMSNPVKTENLPTRVKQQFDKYITTKASGAVEDVAKVTQGNQSINTKLGSAHATPSSGMTWQKYAQQHGTTYTPPTSGVAEADRRAAKIIKNADKADDVTKAFNWKKAGKWAAIGIAVTVVAGLAAWGIKKCNENKEISQDKQEPVPENSTNTQSTSESNSPQVTPTNSAPAQTTPSVINTEVEKSSVSETKPAEPTNTVEPTESTDSTSVIDAEGMMTVQDGDGLCRIARRYLKDKFKNEPDKFKNLSTEEQENLVWQVVDKIKELNGFELVTAIINGKKVLVTEPMIHPGQKIQVVEKLDKAA